MADAIITLTETPQLTLTIENVQNYYWDMTGAIKVMPYTMVRDTIDVGDTYKTYYIDVPANTRILLNHNVDLTIYTFDQDRLAFFHYYGEHTRDVFGPHLQFGKYIKFTNPDTENTTRVYVQFDGVAGNDIRFYTEEISQEADEVALLSRLEKGAPLNNSDFDHISSHIKKSIFDKYEAPMQPIKKLSYSHLSVNELIGEDLFGVWKVELMNADEYRVFMVDMPSMAVTQVVGTGGGLSFMDRSLFEGNYWLCANFFGGWAVCTPMQNIYLSQRPDMRFFNSNFSPL